MNLDKLINLPVISEELLTATGLSLTEVSLRRPNTRGRIIGHRYHNDTGMLCFDVKHDNDDVIAVYDADELRPLGYTISDLIEESVWFKFFMRQHSPFHHSEENCQRMSDKNGQAWWVCIKCKKPIVRVGKAKGQLETESGHRLICPLAGYSIKRIKK